MSQILHKIVTITYKGEEIKFKILYASQGTDIREAIRARFRLPSKAQLILIDNRDRTDVVIDGNLETAAYTLEVVSDSEIGCCPPGSLPATAPPADYKLRGAIEDFEGIQLYVVGKDHKHGKGIILLPDIVGWNSGRIRQIADEFALTGYLTVIPDVFAGDGWDEKKDWKDWSLFGAWLHKSPWSKMQTIIDRTVSYTTKHGAKTLGLGGFCWGGWAIVHACTSNKYAAAVSFHSSVIPLAKGHGEDETALLEAVKVPQLLLTAENDPPQVKKGGLAEQIYKKNGIEVIVHDFEKQAHGWVNRGDISNPEVAKDVRLALDLAKDFFKKHL